MTAQEVEEPKIGLVLSGGGAKGFAHIGVLKVIDSLGIKIDYISGTSMGAVIGSLYATGYSGKQLEALFNSQDFDMLINDTFPRSAKSFYDREHGVKYAVSLPFNKLNVSLPSALSRGQNIYNLLYELMLHVNEVRDFKELPIPFFCVATNVETGAALILDKGKLAEAVTASAALPSLFQPVVIGENVLIDGGVTNNFPVEELRAKGMDIIIGVDVQDDLKDRASLKSALDILGQINNFRTIKAMEDKAPLTDVYIKPDISNFSLISFNEGDDIIANGEAAAKANVDELKKLISKKKSTSILPKIKPLDSIKINSINIKGQEHYTRSYILGKLKFKGNTKVSYADFRKGINNIIATNNFDTFRYYLEPSKDRHGYNLVGELRETEATAFLRLGIHYDDLYKSAALVNLTKKHLLSNNDIASLDLILGDNSRYNFDYFVDKGFYVSIGIKSRFNQFNKNINALLALEEDSPLLVNLNKIDIEFNDFTNQVYLQTLFRKDFSLRVGAEHKRLKITSETLVEESQNNEVTIENTGYFSLFGNLKFDHYDNPYFPKKGLYFNSDFHLYLNASGFNKGFSEFSIFKADLGYAFSFNDKLSLKTEFNGGFKIGEDLTNTLGFGLGGYGASFINNFYEFHGYDYFDLTGDSFIKAAGRLDYEVFKKNHILLAVNFANIENGLFESGNFLSTPSFSGYALGYSLETFLGPLEGRYSYSPETGKGYWFFNLGFWF